MVSQQVTGYWVGFKTKKENLCHRKPFKNDEKYFLFHLKNSFFFMIFKFFPDFLVI